MYLKIMIVNILLIKPIEISTAEKIKKTMLMLKYKYYYIKLLKLKHLNIM